MPTACCAYGCANHNLKQECKDKKVSFHKFPSNNQKLVDEWLVKIKRKNFKPNKNTRICSEHFEDDCFAYQNFTNRRCLKPSAVPTKFVFNKDAKTPRRRTRYTFKDSTPATPLPAQEIPFPQNETLRKTWTISLQRRNWKSSYWSSGCSNDFHANNLDKTSLSRVQVKERAVPCIFAAFPSHLPVDFQSDQWEQTRIGKQRKLIHDAVATTVCHEIIPKTEKHPEITFPQPNRLKTEIECNKNTFDISCSSNYDYPTAQGKMVEAIKYDGITLDVLDQLLLPQKTRYENVLNVDEGCQVIRSMKVTGARAISVVGALSLAVELKSSEFSSKYELHSQIKQSLEHLLTARPTAANLKQVANSTVGHSLSLLVNEEVSVREMKNRVIEEIEKLMKNDISINESIGLHGGMHISSNTEGLVTVLTHCNTGSLTTAGYGTALGVIRWLHEQERLSHVYFTETRPCNQGARLTSYELGLEQIPATLLCDSKVSALMHTKKITAVIVGADRIASNGDTSNEIGTYHIAISAQYHGVPFYVASPTNTLDMTLENGSLIPVEERPHSEMKVVNSQWTTVDGINCWNPAYDITPAELITGGVITEYGVFPAHSLKKLKESFQTR